MHNIYTNIMHITIRPLITIGVNFPIIYIELINFIYTGGGLL